ncbi:Dihydroflavonol-4-reductase [Dactylella cylindrospora]|nr:Dihydroflavonol-4-reductase [Dactylella cylindrospora]
MPPSYVLVTGATGFIGSHIVDALLAKGISVRATYRSKHKAEAMRMHFRGIYGDKLNNLLNFVYTGDLTTEGCFDDAVRGVDSVIHCASPLNFALSPPEILNPAIAGVKSLLASIATSSSIKKLIVLSSFAAILDEAEKGLGPGVTYTAKDWNPVTYEEGLVDLRQAYHASKTLTEKEVWKWADEVGKGKGIGVVSLCPGLVFGPMAYPIDKISELNSSNAELWFLTTGFSPLPKSPIPCWLDVRDLAQAHVTALLDDSITHKRYTLSAPTPFSTQLAADTIRDLFPWGKERVAEGEPGVYPDDCKLEGEIAANELGFSYKGWRDCMIETLGQFKQIEEKEKRREKEKESGIALGMEVKGAGM